MADSSIEWTDAVWNPVRGCAKVSAGCKNCYAMRQAARFDYAGGARPTGVGMGLVPLKPGPYHGLTRRTSHGPEWTGAARFIPEKLGEPLRWRKPRRIFVNSMSDLFHEDVTDEQIAAVFGVMAAAPQHTFQVLTKRPARMADWFRTLGVLFSPEHGVEHLAAHMADAANAADPAALDVDPGGPWPLPNVHLGVSAEDQAAADERIPLLLQCPAAVRFVSAEPLLGPVDLHVGLAPYEPGREATIDWIIAGGESGPGARPCDVAWIRSIVEQCREAGTAVFCKQLGARPVLAEAELDEWPDHVRFTGDGPGTNRGRVLLKSSKGGDPEEWPEYLRVSELPEVPRGSRTSPPSSPAQPKRSVVSRYICSLYWRSVVPIFPNETAKSLNKNGVCGDEADRGQAAAGAVVPGGCEGDGETLPSGVPTAEPGAREVGRELGLTDLVVLKTGRHRFGWMVRLPDGVAFRGCEESTSEDGAWRALGRTLGDLATSARIRLRERDEARELAVEMRGGPAECEGDLFPWERHCDPATAPEAKP